jgi:hypothetical protein
MLFHRAPWRGGRPGHPIPQIRNGGREVEPASSQARMKSPGEVAERSL